LLKKLGGGIRLALAQYRELAAFAQFASDLDEATRRQLERGRRVTEMMKQKQYTPLGVAEIAVSLFAVEKGFCDNVVIEKITSFEKDLHAYFKNNHKDLMDEINISGDYNEKIENSFTNILTEFKKLR
jgi:F-type H+-transporting ATPase subunit alpha